MCKQWHAHNAKPCDTKCKCEGCKSGSKCDEAEVCKQWCTKDAKLSDTKYECDGCKSCSKYDEAEVCQPGCAISQLVQGTFGGMSPMFGAAALKHGGRCGPGPSLAKALFRRPTEPLKGRVQVVLEVRRGVCVQAEMRRNAGGESAQAVVRQRREDVRYQMRAGRAQVVLKVQRCGGVQAVVRQ